MNSEERRTSVALKQVTTQLMETLGTRSKDIAAMLNAARVLAFIHAAAQTSDTSQDSPNLIHEVFSQLDGRIRLSVACVREQLHATREALSCGIADTGTLAAFDEICLGFHHAAEDALRVLANLAELEDWHACVDPQDEELRTPEADQANEQFRLLMKRL